MELYTTVTVIIVITTVIHMINHRLFKIQGTIAITIGACLLSLVLVIAHHHSWFNLQTTANNILKQIDFRDWLLNGLLGLLLFAGALTVDLKSLYQYKWEILTLASIATIASAFIIGFALYYVLPALDIHLPLIYCLLFGSLISPTDPIAVLATMKAIKAPKSLATKIAGESLFNDGIGLVLFVTIMAVLVSGQQPTWHEVMGVFLQESVGGIVYGLLLGLIAYQLIKYFYDPIVIILVTLSMSTAGYVFAQHIEISGPLAMVVSGLIVGQALTISTQTHSEGVTHFWEMIDELLNTFLFFMIGLEILVIPLAMNALSAIIIVIPLCLFARLLTVAIPMVYFKKRKSYPPYIITILTWGGLRGALALAMALSLPLGTERNIILVITYGVVFFAIVIQGLTAKSLIKLSTQDSNKL